MCNKTIAEMTFEEKKAWAHQTLVTCFLDGGITGMKTGIHAILVTVSEEAYQRGLREGKLASEQAAK